MRLVLVDDHRSLADALTLVISQQGLAEVEAIDPCVTDGSAWVEDLAPDLCLIDLELADDPLGGLRFVRAATAAATPVAMFTGCRDDVQLGMCLEAGAAGVISKELAFPDVLERIAGFCNGQSVSSDTDKLRWVLALQEYRRLQASELAPFARLTQREQEILVHLMAGHKADEVAEREVLSLSTVRTHIASVLSKLDVSTQLAAVALAHRAGWSPALSADSRSA